MVKNRKILGAFLVGGSLVVGSYIMSDFGLTPATQTADEIMYVKSNDVTREFIAVADADTNGIEDWREEFVTEAPLILPQVASTTYEMPTTVTDLIGIQMFESFLMAKGGTTGLDQEEVVRKTTERISQINTDTLYALRDIQVIPTTPDATRQYANTAASIVLNNNIPNYETELVILDRAMKTGSEAELKKLEPIAQAYKNMRDQTLATPVPEEFVKQHLDLINVYHALYKSLTDMQLAFADPVVALMRIQRYQDDATGLANGFTNMYLAMEPHASLFTASDPAIIFVQFAPNYQ